MIITQGNSTGMSILTAQKTYKITTPVILQTSARLFFFLSNENKRISTLPHSILIITEKKVIFMVVLLPQFCYDFLKITNQLFVLRSVSLTTTI